MIRYYCISLAILACIPLGLVYLWLVYLWLCIPLGDIPGVSQGGTASSADLGGSSKYSSENLED